MSSAPILKQIAAGRRKPDMTRKEYFEHRFLVHGSISDDIEDPNQKPYKYIQTQVFDSVFGPRADSPFNANQHWSGRDDTTELYFRDWDHIRAVFTSEHVKTKVGPDGPLFADFETSMVLLALEEDLPLMTRLKEEKGSEISSLVGTGDATVAMFFISTPENVREGEQLEKLITPALTKALEENASDDVWGLQVNVGVVSTQFDLNAYFGGGDMPQYALVYKVFLKDQSSVSAFRKAQRAFAATAGEHYDRNTSFVLFSQEALILDVKKGVRFSRDRQPVFGDLTR